MAGKIGQDLYQYNVEVCKLEVEMRNEMMSRVRLEECERSITFHAGCCCHYKIQGCHGTGKTGNLKVHFSRQGKHREFAKKY